MEVIDGPPKPGHGTHIPVIQRMVFEPALGAGDARCPCETIERYEFIRVFRGRILSDHGGLWGVRPVARATTSPTRATGRVAGGGTNCFLRLLA